MVVLGLRTDGLRRNGAMKTADREIQIGALGCATNREDGAEGVKHPRPFTGTGKQENLRRWEKSFS
jgi:hypothetical protein